MITSKRWWMFVLKINCIGEVEVHATEDA